MQYDLIRFRGAIIHGERLSELSIATELAENLFDLKKGYYDEVKVFKKNDRLLAITYDEISEIDYLFVRENNYDIHFDVLTGNALKYFNEFVDNKSRYYKSLQLYDLHTGERVKSWRKV